VLTDKRVHPSDDVIVPHLGRRRSLWEALFAHLHAEHPGFTAEWRYYDDGKSWLMKVQHRKKTVFWLSVFAGSFRITAYFTDKAEAAIRKSGLSAARKEGFLSGPRVGKLRPLTIVFANRRDVEDAKVLIALKVAQGTAGR
jgi:hypothetical protein